MRRSILNLAAAASAALLSWTPAAAAEPRQPSGQWTVDFHESQCVAHRNYGTTAEPFMLALKAPPLGELMELVFIRPGRGSELAEEYDAKIAIDGRAPFSTRMIDYALREKGQRVSRMTLDRGMLASLASAKTLTVNAGRVGINQGFALRNVAPLLKIMDECVADLRSVWNVASGDGIAPQLKTGAIGSLAGLIKHTDYPDAAIKSLKGGTVQVALLIDERGKIADCTLIETSGVPSLDTQTCGIIKGRAKFTPAISRDGKPAKHAALQRVTWRVE